MIEKNRQVVRFDGSIIPSRVMLSQIPEGVVWEEHTQCEACDTTLDILCRLYSEKTGQHIRAGVCDNCGYSGYIDRPEKNWITNFYSKDWDKEFSRTVEDIKSNYKLQEGIVRGSMKAAFLLHTKLPVRKERPVLEIGSGYGQILKNFHDAGFRKVYGIENSHMRAERVTEAFGFKILKGDFGAPEFTEELKQYGPFGTIFSHHVIEHIYDTKAVLQGISALQEEGDSLILSLPSSFKEHSLYQVLYVPHLHSFSPESLEILLNKNGYELVENDTGYATSIIFGAIKKKNPKPVLTKKTSYAAEGIKRLREALKISTVSVGDHYELYWEQKPEETNFSIIRETKLPQALALVDWYVRLLYWSLRKYMLRQFRSGYNMRFTRLPDQIGEGIEIQYKDSIRIMMK